MCTLRGRFPRPRVRRALTQESVSRNFVTLCTHRAAWLIHSSLFSIPGGMWISRRLVSLGWVAAICPDERDLVSQFRSGHLRLMRVCALRDLSLERSTRFAACLRALRDRSLGRFTRFCCAFVRSSRPESPVLTALLETGVSSAHAFLPVGICGLFGTLRGVPRSFLISWTVAFLQLSVLLVPAPLLQGVRT